MARERLYTSDAERQKAYRARLTAVPKPTLASSPPARRRQLSRPARLLALCSGLEQLKGEYEAWLDNLPEPLQEGNQGTRLTEAIEALERVVGLLSEIEPPLGFGRD